MPINIKSQKDSLTTDVVIDLPTNLSEIDQLMRSSKATGRVVATYNQGGLLPTRKLRTPNRNPRCGADFLSMLFRHAAFLCHFT